SRIPNLRISRVVLAATLHTLAQGGTRCPQRVDYVAPIVLRTRRSTFDAQPKAFGAATTVTCDGLPLHRSILALQPFNASTFPNYLDSTRFVMRKPKLSLCPHLDRYPEGPHIEKKNSSRSHYSAAFAFRDYCSHAPVGRLGTILVQDDGAQRRGYRCPRIRHVSKADR